EHSQVHQERAGCDAAVLARIARSSRLPGDDPGHMRSVAVVVEAVAAGEIESREHALLQRVRLDLHVDPGVDQRYGDTGARDLRQTANAFPHLVGADRL